MPNFSDIDPAFPADTDPESVVGQAIRDFKAHVLGGISVEHSLQGEHHKPFSTTSGTGAAYTANLPHRLTTLPEGFVILLKFHASNTTTTPTVTFTTPLGVIGPLVIKRKGGSIPEGFLTLGSFGLLVVTSGYLDLIATNSDYIPTGVSQGLFHHYTEPSGKTPIIRPSTTSQTLLSAPLPNTAVGGVLEVSLSIRHDNRVGGIVTSTILLEGLPSSINLHTLETSSSLHLRHPITVFVTMPNPSVGASLNVKVTCSHNDNSGQIEVAFLKVFLHG